MKANHEPYDEESAEQNYCPPLAISEWQEWQNPLVSEWINSDPICDPRFDPSSLPETDTESVNPDPK